MPRIEPIPRDELPRYEPTFQLVEAAMGFVPSSMRTMAKVPELFEAFSRLAGTITMIGEIDPGLAQMIAHVASTASGCRYCQAHTAAHAAHIGVDDRYAAVIRAIPTRVQADAVEHEPTFDVVDTRPAGRIVEYAIHDVDADSKHTLAAVERKLAHRATHLDVGTGDTPGDDRPFQPCRDFFRKTPQRKIIDDGRCARRLGVGGQIEVRRIAVTRVFELEA